MQLFLCVMAWGAVLATGFKPPKHLTSVQRSRLSKEDMLNEKGVLLDDREIPTVIPSGNTSSYVYLHDYPGPFTLIVRPCNSSINVTISHIHQNNIGVVNDYIKNRSESVADSSGMWPHMFSWEDAPAGLYLVELAAQDKDTLVTLFATKLPSEPAVMHMTQPRVRIVPRLHRNRVTVRWDQSVVDPQMINYYIVVNSRTNFSSLCEAYNSVPGMKVYSMSLKQSKIENSIHKKATAHSLGVRKNAHEIVLSKNDVLITFVGSGTSFTISNLEKGREYFFNIFAEHNNTWLNFLYASKSLVYDSKLRRIGLKDNKPMMVNIRRLGGRALFRYKVSSLKSRSPASALSWHIMPCGAAVQVKVNRQHQVIIPPQTVQGYAHLQIRDPKPGERYALLVSVTDPEQMRQILGVEVLATTRSSLLPELPAEATVYEYSSLRTCDSVTVGWVPVLGQTVRYCVSASPVSFIDLRGHFEPYPNQCNLDNRLSTQFNFAVKQCQDLSANDNRNVLIDTITKLLPDKEYLIQVTVKKTKGKVLSYDLLRVRTNVQC